MQYEKKNMIKFINRENMGNEENLSARLDIIISESKYILNSGKWQQKAESSQKRRLSLSHTHAHPLSLNFLIEAADIIVIEDKHKTDVLI